MWTEELWSCWWKCNSMQPPWKCFGVACKVRNSLWETALSVPVLHRLSCAPCLQPSGLHPARLLCPWEFPGKDTGVGCHACLQWSCWTRDWTCDSFFLYEFAGRFFTTSATWEGRSERVSRSVVSDSLQPHRRQPGSSVQGLSQARILQGVAIPFFRGSSQPRYQTRVSHTAGRFFAIWVTRESTLSPNTVPLHELNPTLYNSF